jgi:hypothetical protein
MRLGQLADDFVSAGDRLASVGSLLGGADPGAGAFGAEAPGRVGEVGRLLHGLWSSALSARAREAAAQAARLVDTAEALDAADVRYRDAEHAAGKRLDVEAT